MTAAGYLRASTDRQTTNQQRREVVELARRVASCPARAVEVVEETASGAKGRPLLDGLCSRLRAGDVLAVWALDRLGRRMVEVVNRVQALKARGVRVLSVREPWLDTGGPVADLLLAVFAWVAEQERARLSERVNAKLAHVRRHGSASGLPIGRSPVPASALEEARRKIEAGATVRAACASTIYELPAKVDDEGRPVRRRLSEATYRRWRAQKGSPRPGSRGDGLRRS